MDEPYKQYEESLDNYFWLAEQVDLNECWQAISLGELLYTKLHPTSVIDLGCSSGIYLTPFMAWGVTDVLGVDGAHGVGKHIPGKFQVVDLRIPWTPPKRYDLCLCVETAEHLKPEYADILMDTIVGSSDTVFFTAAREGQGGEGHFNMKNRPYWIEKFQVRGYDIHPKNDEVMAVVNQDWAFEKCGWVRWNGMLLGKKA